MRHGSWSSDFLLEYGDALLEAEHQHGTRVWEGVAGGNLNLGDRGDAGFDPVAGLMTALSRQLSRLPEAS